jgi:hypothetical protein
LAFIRASGGLAEVQVDLMRRTRKEIYGDKIEGHEGSERGNKELTGIGVPTGTV